MTFVLDKSADLPIAAYLIRQGHDVAFVGIDYPRSLSDQEVLSISRYEGRILITNDSDFGNLLFRGQVAHARVLYFRLGSEALSVKIAWLDHVLSNYGHVLDQFIVIADQGIRIRQT